jgi:hypothetical protein
MAAPVEAGGGGGAQSTRSARKACVSHTRRTARAASGGGASRKTLSAQRLARRTPRSQPMMPNSAAFNAPGPPYFSPRILPIVAGQGLRDRDASLEILPLWRRTAKTFRLYCLVGKTMRTPLRFRCRSALDGGERAMDR